MLQLLSNKDVEVEVVVKLFAGLQADPDVGASLVASVVRGVGKTKSVGMLKMMLSKGEKALIRDVMDTIRAKGVTFEEESLF